MEINNPKNKRTSFYALLSFLLLLLLSFNGASIFSVKIVSPDSSSSSQENRDSRNLISVSSSSSSSSPLMYAVKEENPRVISKTQLKSHTDSTENMAAGAGDFRNFISVPSFMHAVQEQKQHVSVVKQESSPVVPNTRLKSQTNSPENLAAGAGVLGNFVSVPSFMHTVQQQQQIPLVISNNRLPLLRKSHSFSLESENSYKKTHKAFALLTSLGYSPHRRMGDFPARVEEFFSRNETFYCKVRFFMTWISPLTSFTNRELHSIEALFKTHPNGCLIIVSNSMDSTQGMQILRPFLDKGFRVMAISPDFEYLFKNTMAESWFSRLTSGNVKTGYIPLGQNLSNLIRLCLLYKFGGAYIDTDVIILKSFASLKNSIGAQTLGLDSKNWSRLNNAVMVFDKMHPLVYKFIQEFALTFNGNRWGHNGPYLVSRVVSRLQERPGYEFTILPPTAFYPVTWDRVRNLFRGAKDEIDSKWLRGKLRQIRRQSYAVHLWNKQSRELHVEEGSILKRILSDHCIFCNSSAHAIVSV